MLLLLFTCLLALLVCLLLLFASGARRSTATGSRGSSMATAASSSELEREEGSENVQGEQPTAGDSEGWKTVQPKFSHPIYKKLSCLNGELNALSLSELKEKLTSLNLSAV